MNLCQPWGQSMTSAPKDGTDILVANSLGLIIQAYWDLVDELWRVSGTATPFADPVLWKAIPPMQPESLRGFLVR